MGDFDEYLRARDADMSRFRARNVVGAAGFEPTTTSPPDGLTPHDDPPSPSIYAHGSTPTRTDAHPEWVAQWVTERSPA
jgi:hypothetical protein